MEQLNEQEAFLALCLAVASQDNDLDETERVPIVKGMKETGLISCEYELKDILSSTTKKISSVFEDGKAFSFNEKTLALFTEKIKNALSEEKTEKLFETAVDIAIADGILEVETELDLLKKIHKLLGISTEFTKIIENRTHL
ncbi:MAG: TerB family tellurite resistance protein [Thermodesulfobacteriota bacterium]